MSAIERYVTAGGQRIRVNVRPGTGVPLVLCNGIGASLEVLDPFVEQLDPATGDPVRRARHRRITHLPFCPTGSRTWPGCSGRVLAKLGYGVVDVLGLSWGGALAQQFAFQNPRRCRRLVLVATGTGALMVPAHPTGAGEDADPAPVRRSRLCRRDRRRPLRRQRAPRRRSASRRLFERQLRRIEDRLPAPTARRARCGPACSRCPPCDSRR